MELHEIRRWVESHRAAQERERREVVERGFFVADPIAAGLSLITMLCRTPGSENPLSQYPTFPFASAIASSIFSIERFSVPRPAG